MCVCVCPLSQLRAARYDIHDIFFEMPLEERLALLQLDREVRAERKLREMVTSSSTSQSLLCDSVAKRDAVDVN